MHGHKEVPLVRATLSDAPEKGRIVPPSSLQQLLRVIASGKLDALLGQLDIVAIPDETAPPTEVTRGNRRWQLNLSIVDLGTSAGAASKPEAAAAPALPTSPVAAPPRRPTNGDLKLRRIHKKMLEKSSLTEPVSAKTLIRISGYADNSYAREALTQLARARLLVRTPDGYYRAPDIQAR